MSDSASASNRAYRLATRRELLQTASAAACGVLLDSVFPGALARAASPLFAQQPGAPPADAAAAFRAQLAAIPIQAQKLNENLTLLSGPGGNVLVLEGSDGKLLVDTFVSPAWEHLKQSLDALGNAPLNFVFNTHWHFDHTDNNAPLHAAGATIIAHENTRRRMSEAHDLAVLGLHFPPSPPEALPQKIFRGTYRIEANGEHLSLAHIPPAHTDTDVYVHFEKANVLHAGDVFFNRIYPYIDGSTGGNVNGMIAGVNTLLSLANDDTKIVPGHGPLGNKADLRRYGDMLSTARDRVLKLKSSGKSLQEAVAAKPFADLDPVWGKGHFNGDAFVQIVYITL